MGKNVSTHVVNKNDLPFPLEEKILNSEEKLIINLYERYFEVSLPLYDPCIDDNATFFVIHSEDNHKLLYNPVGFRGFGNMLSYFFYSNMITNDYKYYTLYEEIKKSMSSSSIEKFETVSEMVSNIMVIMKQLPDEFYSDDKLIKMMLNHFDKEPTIKRADFYKQVNDYVVKEFKKTIVHDLKKNELKPVKNLVDQILELNKVTKKINSIEDIKIASVGQDSDTKELIKNINRAVQEQIMNHEFQM